MYRLNISTKNIRLAILKLQMDFLKILSEKKSKKKRTNENIILLQIVFGGKRVSK